LLKFESDIVCAPYRHGKMIVVSPSLVSTVMTECPGQLLHIDVAGPSRFHSMGDKWYVLVIVDDYLKVIRSENETEFRNASFDQFCLEHGVDQQFFAPHVPQQNGVME
jgi:hypothetical protein